MIYTNKICYIYSGHSASHKQGKLPAGVALNEIGDTRLSYELAPAHTKAVIEVYDPDRNSDYSVYPAFWIKKADADDGTAPQPPVEPPVDPGVPPVGGIPSADQVGLMAGMAVAALLKYVFMR